MALVDVQQRLKRARGNRTRRDVVDAAERVPGAPETLSEERLRRMECSLQSPPTDGGELRAVVAVLGVPLVDVLRDLGYWPPLATDREAVAVALVEEAARIAGWREVVRAGDKLVIHR